MPTLLVIDDESSILLAFRRAYRNHDLEVLTAETATAGLALARERRPDVIIFDIPASDAVLGGTYTIALMAALPTITVPVTIDGTSQPGYEGTPIIVLDGGGGHDELVLAETGRAVGAVPFAEHVQRVVELRQVLDLAPIGSGRAVPQFTYRHEGVLVGQPVREDVWQLE